MFDLHGKVAVVTGASVGLGRGFAFAMARQGADVAILARRKEKLDQVAEEVRSLGVKCLPVKCDVNDLEEVKAALDTILTEFGKVDILINNAGGGTSMPILEMTDEAYFKDINTDRSARPVQVPARVRQGDGQAGLRPHHQHCLDSRPRR